MESTHLVFTKYQINSIDPSAHLFLRSFIHSFIHSFQFFIVSALLVGLVAAQGEDEVPEGRTRICKEGEFPGKRNKRQAAGPPGPDAPKPCWFIPDATIASGDDCEARFTETGVCEKSQVFVPLGVVSSPFSRSYFVKIQGLSTAVVPNHCSGDHKCSRKYKFWVKICIILQNKGAFSCWWSSNSKSLANTGLEIKTS